MRSIALELVTRLGRLGAGPVEAAHEPKQAHREYIPDQNGLLI